ncbi:MAG: RluA family pseudouridine synthase [Patescibacteria group bacterium]
MDIKIIYENDDILIIDKPAGIVVFNEITSSPAAPRNDALIDLLIEKYPSLGDIGSPPRYGIAHRLDKDTSGILLVAKSNEVLIFLQNQFINRRVEKKYIALICGNIKNDFGEIKTLISRAPGDKRKQKSYLPADAPKSAREAITEYKVVERYKDYSLLEVKIKTGRKHQIRCHLSYIHHPIAGDKIYGFKDSPTPKGLTRQFLHAVYLKIQLPGGEIKEFKSELPEGLEKILDNLKLKI